MRTAFPLSMVLRWTAIFLLFLPGEGFAEDAPTEKEPITSGEKPSKALSSKAFSPEFSSASPLSKRLRLTEISFEPQWGKSLILDPQAALPPTLQSPEIGRTYVYSLGGRQGDHSLLFTAATSESSRNSPNGARLPVNFGFAGLEYRYHGLFGGIVRPVLRLSGGAQSMYLPSGPSVFQPGFGRYAAAEAGLEIVYKGVGVGFTTGYQWIDEQEERTFHLPVPAKGRRNKGADWSKLLNHAIKRIYLILE